MSSVTFPSTLIKLDRAFTYCKRLEQFQGKYVSEDGRCVVIDGKLLAFASYGLTSYSIPVGIETIGEHVFFRNNSLQSIQISEGVRVIEYEAFFGSRSLTSVTIPQSVELIVEKAFSELPSLGSFNGKYSSSDNRCLIVDGELIGFAPSGMTSYVIPDDVVSIGPEAFRSYSDLEEITIPTTVETIGLFSFWLCKGLKAIYVQRPTPPHGEEGMFDDTNNCPIYVPAESVEAYKAAEYWSDYADRIRAAE